jgi:hypothetical protein
VYVKLYPLYRVSFVQLAKMPRKTVTDFSDDLIQCVTQTNVAGAAIENS